MVDWLTYIAILWAILLVYLKSTLWGPYFNSMFLCFWLSRSEALNTTHSVFNHWQKCQDDKVDGVWMLFSSTFFHLYDSSEYRIALPLLDLQLIASKCAIILIWVIHPLHSDYKHTQKTEFLEEERKWNAAKIEDFHINFKLCHPWNKTVIPWDLTLWMEFDFKNRTADNWSWNGI